ncbi:OmpP1/FadL family transporter [Novosphingobium mangrovi (ex Huang et al. 2023)]|uniref:TonB-dependent receptor n=1 Tax=Novosphingobium mangrovi (ex Huang et al. 2023) TaxID=2976432 RepID=A0ABT2I1U9_9SPHN|nr:outer membrane protein transport protein [Novosphingobium mangrovi (ex Huang et al. 2023)]MCT2398776.1 TonB-dependent receptor [Novosphingobium mangrovi (ex Huang et al. 2023)]
MSFHVPGRAGRILPLTAIVFTLGATAALPETARATDGYFLNGAGAKAKGAGGVEIAMPQDALAISVNPAAATVVGHRLDIGMELFVPDRGARISGNGAGLDGTYSGNGANPFVLPEAGYVRPLSDSVAVGITINGNGGMNTHYKANPFANFGASGPAGVNLRQIMISPVVAVKLAEGHSLGVSPVLVLQSFKLHGAQPFAGFSQDPAQVSNNGTDWTTGVGVRIGYLGSIGKNVRVGAFYQSKVWSGRFKNYGGLFAQNGSFDIPASWGVGASVSPTADLTLGADYKRIEYSGVQAVGNTLAALFEGVPFGADNGPGFGWRDVDVWKVGAVYKATSALTLRAGYGRSDNPVPRSQTLLNILAPGVVRGHYTLGATVNLSQDAEVTGYVMRAPRQTVRGSGSIPASFGGGEADVHLAETAVGLSFGLSL